MAEHHNHRKVVSSEEWRDARQRLLLSSPVRVTH